MALQKWQGQAPDVFQLRNELLLKVLFGSFAAPGDLAQNLRNAIAQHELRLMEYRQNALFLPTGDEVRQGHGNKRRNPYAAEKEADPYFGAIVHFAIEFEKMYVRWLYETLEFVETRTESERKPGNVALDNYDTL